MSLFKLADRFEVVLFVSHHLCCFASCFTFSKEYVQISLIAFVILIWLYNPHACNYRRNLLFAAILGVAIRVNKTQIDRGIMKIITIARITDKVYYLPHVV